MPSPALYVAVAVVGTVAAALAFKEFVYEPHIAPKFEAWAETYVENRRRRRARAQPVAVPQSSDLDENEARRLYQKKNSKKDKKDRDDRDDSDDGDNIELDDLAKASASTSEVDGWRRGVPPTASLRLRRPAPVIDETNYTIPYDPLTPTHVIFDSDRDSHSSGGSTPPRGSSHYFNQPQQQRSTPSHSSHSPSLHRSPPSPSLHRSPPAPHSPPPSLPPHTLTANPKRRPSIPSPIARLPTPVSIISVSSFSPSSTRATSPDLGPSPSYGPNPSPSMSMSMSMSPTRSPAQPASERSVSSMSSYAPAVVGPQAAQANSAYGFGSPRSEGRTIDTFSDVGSVSVRSVRSDVGSVRSEVGSVRSEMGEFEERVTSPFDERVNSPFEDRARVYVSPAQRQQQLLLQQQQQQGQGQVHGRAQGRAPSQVQGEAQTRSPTLSIHTPNPNRIQRAPSSSTSTSSSTHTHSGSVSNGTSPVFLSPRSAPFVISPRSPRSPPSAPYAPSVLSPRSPPSAPSVPTILSPRSPRSPPSSHVSDPINGPNLTHDPNPTHPDPNLTHDDHDFEIPSDMEVLSPSLRSGMFSPSLVDASPSLVDASLNGYGDDASLNGFGEGEDGEDGEDPFEVGSVHGSEFGSVHGSEFSWASMGSGRSLTPDPRG
ncbi:hypothetical protein K474DRAFT_1665029 [Panus rudis PR-1116 ss-1]|nr:hypothetical protein K474DRAFT_1665029 [Panus rudis PR-1116 ss-1]